MNTYSTEWAIFGGLICFGILAVQILMVVRFFRMADDMKRLADKLAPLPDPSKPNYDHLIDFDKS